MVALGERQIVGGAQGLLAQGGEGEHRHAAGGAGHLDPPAAHGQLLRPAFIAVGEGAEDLDQAGVGLGAGRAQIDLHVAQALQPVVDRAFQRHHVDLAQQQVDEGQEAVAVEAVLVEAARRPVRGGDDHDAVLEQALEQAAQNHGIGDVDDVELVEAEQPVLGREPRRPAPCSGSSRPPSCRSRVQPLLHVQHELVEVHPPLRLERHRGEEEVHEHRLAAADIAMEVDAARRLGRRVLPPEAEPAQEPAAVRLRRRPVGLQLARQPLEPVGSRPLQRVGLELACGDLGLQALEQHGPPPPGWLGRAPSSGSPGRPGAAVPLRRNRAPVSTRRLRVPVSPGPRPWPRA